jgi:hypothetical protein
VKKFIASSVIAFAAFAGALGAGTAQAAPPCGSGLPKAVYCGSQNVPHIPTAQERKDFNDLGAKLGKKTLKSIRGALGIDE